MSTFERVKKNILRDMDLSKVHTAESWCNIMLQNTNRLTSVQEQKKFWAWMVNPYDDEDMPAVQYEFFEKHAPIEKQERITVPVDGDDEKSAEVELSQEYTRNGQTMYIRVKNYESGESAPRAHADEVGEK